MMGEVVGIERCDGDAAETELDVVAVVGGREIEQVGERNFDSRERNKDESAWTCLAAYSQDNS